jgi:hypothetical protein
MLGLAMGVPAEELGVQRHLVSVDPLIKAIKERKAEHTASPLSPGRTGQSDGNV